MTNVLDLLDLLKEKIIIKDEIYDALEFNSHFCLVFRKCINYTITVEPEHAQILKPNYETIMVEIDSVIDFLHDEINTGHWSNVPLGRRRAFTAASFIKALIIINAARLCDRTCLEKALKALDTGLLLGAPLLNNPELLTTSASFISQKIAVLAECDNPSNLKCIKVLKRKLSISSSEYNNILGEEVCSWNCPSVQYFDEHYLKKQTPVKITGCMTHWPAMTKWQNMEYFLRLAGDRTVPIEIGSHYTDEDWSQKLITLKQFIKEYFLNSGNTKGYLAQHNLFDQIAELKEDIHVPEYCCLSESDDDYCEPDINAWFGPEGTVSPLHYDPKNNLLAQVFGTKQVLLFSPEDSEFLYPYDNPMLFNTAQVNPVDLDVDKFPLSKKAKLFKCLLKPGEILFIPQRWWHHVTALEKSFSVSFWWK